MVDYCSYDESRTQIKYCHQNTTITYLSYIKFKVCLKYNALKNYIFKVPSNQIIISSLYKLYYIIHIDEVTFNEADPEP